VSESETVPCDLRAKGKETFERQANNMRKRASTVWGMKRG